MSPTELLAIALVVIALIGLFAWREFNKLLTKVDNTPGKEWFDGVKTTLEGLPGKHEINRLLKHMDDSTEDAPKQAAQMATILGTLKSIEDRLSSGDRSFMGINTRIDKHGERLADHAARLRVLEGRARKRRKKTGSELPPE